MGGYLQNLLGSGSDCDDTDAKTSPSRGFNEISEGCFRDADSDGYADKLVDDELMSVQIAMMKTILFSLDQCILRGLCLVDSDGDGYGDASGTDERYDIGRDCDDDDAMSYPNAYEVCDDKDNCMKL